MKSHDKLYRFIFAVLIVTTLFFSNAYNLQADCNPVNGFSSEGHGTTGQKQITAHDNVIIELLYKEEAISNISHNCLLQNTTKVRSEKLRYGIFADICLIAAVFFLVLVKHYSLCNMTKLHSEYYIIRFIHRKDGKK